MKYESILSYLDNTLPSRWRIMVQNFFSYFLPIESIDLYTDTLRKLVDNSNNMAYLSFYDTHVQFHPNDADEVGKSPSEVAYYEAIDNRNITNVYQHLKEIFYSDETVTNETPETPVESKPIITPVLDKRGLVQAVVKDKSFDKLVTAENTQQVLYYFLEKATTHEQKRKFLQAAVTLIEDSEVSIAAEKEILFNSLATENDVIFYQNLLNYRSERLYEQSYELILALGREIDPKTNSEFKVNRDFSTTRYSVGIINSKNNCNEHLPYVQKLQTWLKSWGEMHSDMQIAATKIVAKLRICLNHWVDLLKQTADPRIESFIQKCQMDKQQQDNLEIRRIELCQSIGNRTIIQIGREELMELYPDEKEFEAMMEKLDKAGISVSEPLSMSF